MAFDAVKREGRKTGKVQGHGRVVLNAEIMPFTIITLSENSSLYLGIKSFYTIHLLIATS